MQWDKECTQIKRIKDSVLAFLRTTSECFRFRRSSSDPACAGPPSPRGKVFSPHLVPFNVPLNNRYVIGGVKTPPYERER